MIRHATFADLPAIGSLLLELEYEPAPGLDERVRRLIADPDEALLVYELDGETVGLLSLHFIPQVALGDFARISYFVVAAKVRGKGIGDELEAHITALALARNCDRIELHCHSRRIDAHRFYDRQGYRESPKYLVKSLRAGQ
ncbi:MAG TPA: GNAT family N-acetyltransferase [Puia sp.]|nr:GNAT family N-acetyltransferase [Puia sp.]